MADKQDQSQSVADKTALPETLLAKLSDHKRWISTEKRQGSRADLNGQDLSGADLSGRDLRDASFRHAKLRRADLRTAMLTGTDFGGADLTDALLPEGFRPLDTLQNIAEACKNCRQLAVVLAAAATVALLTTRIDDFDLFFNPSQQLALPLIPGGAKVGPRIFFIVAPLILLASFIQFHLSLYRIWKLATVCPARFPDGMSLESRLYPWLITYIVSSRFPQLSSESRRSLEGLQRFMTVVVVWWGIPAVLFIVCVAYLPERDPWGAATQIAALGGAILWAQFGLWQMDRTLRDKPEGNFFVAPFRHSLIRTTIVASVLVGLIGLISYVSYQVLNGDLVGNDLAWANEQCPPEVDCPPHLRVLLALVRLPGADFTGLDPSKSINAKLRSRDLRYAFAPGVDFSKADLSDTRMSVAYLRASNFREAILTGAVLDHAQLSASDLSDADLQGANLRNAHAMLADLQRARLQNANLFSADLSGADLSGADLSGADLTDAHLRNAILSDADFSGAILERADLRGTDLRRTSLTAEQLKTACRDSTTTLPNGARPAVASESCSEGGPIR